MRVRGALARRIVALATVVALGLAATGCARGPANAPVPARPVWAAQWAWSPSPASLQIDYNSSNRSAPVSEAYDSTAAVLASPGWQVHTC